MTKPKKVKSSNTFRATQAQLNTGGYTATSVQALNTGGYTAVQVSKIATQITLKVTPL